MKIFSLFLLSFLLFSFSYSNNKINYFEPIPGASFVNENNNIILGFEKQINLKESDLMNCLIVIGSQSSMHNGTVIICSDRKKIIFKPSFPFMIGEEIIIKLTGKLLKTISSGEKEVSYKFNISPQKIIRKVR